MEAKTPQTAVFTINGESRIFFKNPFSSPSNQYLTEHSNVSQIPTVAWLAECRNYGIPQDQSSLIAIYLRNLQSNLDKTGKKELTAAEFLHSLPFATQTLTEPVQRETNTLHQEIADRHIMLQILKQEKDQIIAQAEKGTNLYIWLLLGLTIAQFGIFYWTIFQVDWLGSFLMTQAGISWSR